MADLTVIILTYNEQLHIKRAIETVRSFAARVIIVDSFSSDRTVEIAREAGAAVLQNKFVNHARQLRWALANAPIETEWVMRLDADEIVEPDLAQEISDRLSSLPSSISGINLRRKHIFLGRWIRFGGRYPVILLRIWRRGDARVEDRWMDEHIVLVRGAAFTFSGGFSDHNLKDLTDFTNKHNRYATHEAIDVVLSRRGMTSLDSVLSGSNTSLQASKRRFAKTKIYNRLPFYVAAPLYFGFRYFVQLGFLDGVEGLIYHFLQAFWYRFLVGAKVVELERAISKVKSDTDALSELARLTGYNTSEFAPAPSGENGSERGEPRP